MRDVKRILRSVSFTSVEKSRWPDVYIAAGAQFFGALATFLVMVTLLLSFQQSGASGWEVSALIIVEAVPMVVLGRLIGRMIDRFDSRMLLVVSGVGQVLACLALSRAERFESVIAGALLLSAISAVAIPTRQALLPAMVIRDDLPKASAIGQTAGSAGVMLGPALAGFLVGGSTVRLTLELAALGFLATIVAGLVLRTRRGTRAAKGETGSQVSWRLASDRLLWSSVWGMTSVMAAISAVNVVLVFFILGTLKSTPSVYGVIDSMWMVGILVGAWVFSRLIRPTTTDGRLAIRLLATLGFLSAALLAVGSVTHALWIVPCYLVGGALNGGLNVLMGTLIGRRAPIDARGRASAALSSRIQAGALLGYVAGGLLLEISQPRWIVAGCGVLGIIVVLAVLPLVRRVSQSPQAPGEVEPVTVG